MGLCMYSELFRRRDKTHALKKKVRSLQEFRFTHTFYEILYAVSCWWLWLVIWEVGLLPVYIHCCKSAIIMQQIDPLV